MRKSTGKFSSILAFGMAVFLGFGIQSEAIDEVYREPVLSGPTQTWVYKGESFDNGRNRVFADDLEDGDLTAKIQKTGNVDTSTAGDYTVSYKVTDSDGRSRQMTTSVKVLDRNTAGAEDRKIRRTLYTLADASHLTNPGINFNRGYYHDRQSLGFWMTADAELRIRIVNGEAFGQNLRIDFMNDDAQTESHTDIPKNGEWVTVKNTSKTPVNSVPFIVTPKNTSVQPEIEFEWSDKFKEIPYYRYKDSETEFFSEWNKSNAPFAIMEGSAATFLTPLKDKDHIINSKYSDRPEYRFRSIDEMLEWYASFVKQYDEFAGLEYDAEEPYNQNVRSKFFIKANKHGAGQAYYSGDHSAYNGDSLQYYLSKHWLSLHEFGHGYEGTIATQENPFVETTNNIMGYYFESTYRVPDDFGWLLGGRPGKTIQEKYINLGEKAFDRVKNTTSFAGIIEGANHYDVSLFMFTNILDKIGPQKGVSSMHSQYRKYYYENGKTASSSDMIVESFSRASGYNVAPYFDFWHIRPSGWRENRLYNADQPMLFYLKELIPNAAEAETVRSQLGLDSIYSLVSTDELAYTGYQSQVELRLSIDDLSQVQNKKILIKNGTKVVKEVPITGNTLSVELPVGIYEAELPAPKTASYHYGNEYLLAVKGNAVKELEYVRENGNPLSDDTEIRLLGMSDATVAVVSLDSVKEKLTWTVNKMTPNSYVENTYISIRVLNPSGKEIFRQAIAGNEEVSSGVTELDFPQGSKVELYHHESQTRLRFMSRYTGNRMDFYDIPAVKQTVTYVMTERGLMQENWDQEKRMNAYLETMENYSRLMMENMSKSDLKDPDKFHEEKMTMQKAYMLLDEEAKADYQEKYGALTGAKPAVKGYVKIDSSKLTGSADSEQGGREGAASALDGDAATIWHTNYGNGVKPNLAAGTNNGYTILLDKNTDIGKLEYVPRAGGGNGTILSYEIYYSTTADQNDFQKVKIRNNTWGNNGETKSVEFDAPNARRIRICALSTGGNDIDKYISAAEFGLYEKYQITAADTWLSDLYQAAEMTDELVQKDSVSKEIRMEMDKSAVWDMTGREFDVFSALACVETAEKSAKLEIYGDGMLLWQSEVMTCGETETPVWLKISGVKKLELRTIGENGPAVVVLKDAKLGNHEDKTQITLKVGELAAVSANTSLIPRDRGKMTWESSDEEVVSVNEEGVLRAVGEGQAVVRAVYASETVTCSVSVEKAPVYKERPHDVEDNNTVTPPPKQNTGSNPDTPTPPTPPTPPEKKVSLKTSIKKVKGLRGQAVVYWKKADGAKGYEVWMKTGRKYKKVKAVSAKKLSLKIKKLKKGKKYTFKVRAYRKEVSGKKIYGKFSKVRSVRVKK